VVTVPVKGKTAELDITDELRAARETIVSPISETMIDLLARVEPEYQEKVRINVILAGGSSAISGLSEALEHALAELGGGRTSIVKEPVFAGSDGGLAIARDATGSDWDRLAA
jgi:rod shape-determining protein MreB